MLTYIIRRVLQAIPVLWVVVIIVFLLLRLSPGDPATAMLGNIPGVTKEIIDQVRSELGIDKPLVIQYVNWQVDLLRGDFGQSYYNKVPVTTLIGQRLPKSMELAVVALAIALPFSLGAGILAAVKRGTWIDHAATAFVTAGIAIPGFWLAIMLVLLFSVQLEWLPSSGYVSFFDDPLGHIKILILPALTLAILVAAPSMRFLRSSMIEVLNEDYIRTARAKGLGQRIVVNRHAVKNALIPTVTFVGLQFASLLAGTILIEWVFGWTGIGWLIVNAIHAQDYLVVQGGVIVMAFFFVVVNLAVDILYAVLDPRIRY
jgi:peptide/nickel transport system permease protein